MILKLYIYIYLDWLIYIYNCSDGAFLLYYNKNETEFSAPKFKALLSNPKVNVIIAI